MYVTNCVLAAKQMSWGRKLSTVTCIYDSDKNQERQKHNSDEARKRTKKIGWKTNTAPTYYP